VIALGKILAPTPESDPRAGAQWLNAAVFAGVILTIALCVLLLDKIKQSVLPQNCHMAGFTNCGAVGLPRPEDSAPSRVIRVPAPGR
jgi:hypothetical protein